MIPTNTARPSPKILSSLWLRQEYPIYPTLGLVSTIMGTMMAIFMMPEDTSTVDALFPCAVVISIGLAIAPVTAAFRSLRGLLRTEHILALAPIYWLLLDLLQQAYAMETIPRDSITGTFLSIGLFTSGVWIAVLISPWSLPSPLIKAANHRLNPSALYKLILLFFSLAILKYAIPSGFNPMVMLYHLGSNRWSTPWTRGQLGGWNAFVDHLDYFGYLLPTLTTLLATRLRRMDGRLISSICLSIIMTAFLAQGGGRRIVGVVLGAAIICWVLEQQKLKIKQIIIVLVSIILLLGTMQWMLEYRNTGYQAALQEQKESHYEYLHVDDNFLRLAQTITLVPRYHSHTYINQIIFPLIRPIPRVFWSGKPVDSGFDLPSALGTEYVTLSFTVIGDWYVCAGFIGVFLGGMVYGGLAKMVSQLLIENAQSSSAIIYSLGTMCIFAGFRSLLELVLMSYTLLAWMFVSWLMLPKQKSF